MSGDSLSLLFYNACTKMAPYNLTDPLRSFLIAQNYNLTLEDRELFGLILCLKDVKNMQKSKDSKKLSIEEKKTLLPILYMLLTQVKNIAKKHFNNNVIVVSKSQRLIFFARRGKIVSSMTDTVAFGIEADKNGPKRRMGDNKTPEGEYQIVSKNPKSKYTLFLGINYPTSQQAEIAFKEGKINISQKKAIESAHKRGAMPPHNTPLGGSIGIHGLPTGKKEDIASATDLDWTLGCIALENYMIRRYFNEVKLKTPVLILP